MLSIHRTGNRKIDIGAFQRIANWLDQGGGTMYPALLEDAFDLFGGDQRARRIMHSDIFRVGTKTIQTSAHGILMLFAISNNRADFVELFLADELIDFA